MSKAHLEFWSDMSDLVLGKEYDMENKDLYPGDYDGDTTDVADVTSYNAALEVYNHLKSTKLTYADVFGKKVADDPVNHPAHYTDGKIEVIDFIEDKKLGFHLGNAVKYIARAGKKDPDKEIEDLEKAVWYINRRIKQLKNTAE